MAIAFEGATDLTDNAGASNSHTLGFTVSSGSDRLLVVAVLGDAGAGVDDITGVTFDSVSCAFLGKTVGDASSRNTYFYYLLGPNSGAHNVIITAGTTHYVGGVVADYSGVSQTGQPDASTTHASGAHVNTLTTSVTTVIDNSWTILVTSGYDANNAPGAGTGSTRRVYLAAYGNVGIFDSNGVVTPPGSYSMTSTYPGASGDILHVMGSFFPVGGVAPDTNSARIIFRKA